MQRTRQLAGPPVRSASAAWGVLTELVADTLSLSRLVTAEDVRTGLAPLAGIGPALIAGGHLKTSPIVVVSGDLHLSITVATSDAAGNVEENLNPVPGGAGADESWMAYLPVPPTLAAVVTAASGKSSHLSVSPPPKAEAASTKEALIDLSALDRLGS